MFTPAWPSFLVVGRTEAEVGEAISAAILEEGHTEAAFVIVGSGPHGADPHHEVSDRVIESGDIVVIDIGGPVEPGYNSDSTRTYSMGQPSTEVAAQFAVLEAAQQAAVDSVRPGVSAESVDVAAREVLAAQGLAEVFVHPHRSRYRAVRARGAVHRRGQHHRTRRRYGLQHRTGNLLPRQLGCPYRGHRRRDRRRLRVVQQTVRTA